MQLIESPDTRLSGRGVPRFSQVSRWERLYIVLALIYMSDAFVGVFTPVEVGALSRDPVDVLLEASIYLIAGVLVFKHWPRFSKTLADCKWVLALVGLALMSTLWAPDPFVAFRQALWLGLSTMFGMYFGTRFSRDEQVSLVTYTLGALAILSLLLALLAPGYGTDQLNHFGDWRGVFNEKNVLARVMVLGVVAALCSPSRRVLGSALLTGQMCLFYVLIARSGSVTGIVAGLVLLLVSLFLKTFRLPMMARLSIAMLVLAAITVGVALFQDHSSVLDILGRDDTLTGRTELWDEVMAAIGSKPLLGYGFSSFWRGQLGVSARIIDAIGWATPYAHNGFLDLCLELGLLGVSIFAMGFLSRLRTAFIEFRRIGSPTSMWPLLFLCFLLAYNLTESTLVAQRSLFWALYVSILVPHARTCSVQALGAAETLTSIENDQALYGVSTTFSR